MEIIFNNQDVINNSPILILDFDGVFFAPEYIQTPKLSAINELNRIIEETKCKIVVCSSHKMNYNHDVNLIHSKFEEWGIKNAEIVGFTYGIRSGNAEFNGREDEINYWINLHKPKNYCALDDSIREDYRWVDVIHMLGITKHDADRVISWLNTNELPEEMKKIHINDEELKIIKKSYGEDFSQYVNINILYVNNIPYLDLI